MNESLFKPALIWFTGLSGAGKTTLAQALAKQLRASSYPTFILDGDELRNGMNSDLGFSTKDRNENVRRVTELAKLLIKQEAIVLVALISPIREQREWARKQFDANEFIEVFVDAPLDVCIQRDPKKLYVRAQEGEIKSFTGLDSPYEAPLNPELHLRTDKNSATELTQQSLEFLKANSIVSVSARKDEQIP